MPIDQSLKDRISALPDEAIVRMIEGAAEEYTPDAIECVKEELLRRGGIEALKLKVAERAASGIQAEEESSSQETSHTLRILYPIVVFVAYGLFMYAIDASLWLYWLGLFAFIGSLFTVLFIRRKAITVENSGGASAGVTNDVGADLTGTNSANAEHLDE